MSTPQPPAAFPIPPPTQFIPIGKTQPNGAVVYTPEFLEMMQFIWAAIQGTGGLFDVSLGSLISRGQVDSQVLEQLSQLTLGWAELAGLASRLSALGERLDEAESLALLALTSARPSEIIVRSPDYVVTASELLAPGAFGNLYDNGGAPGVRNAIATDMTTLCNCYCLAGCAIGAPAPLYVRGVNTAVSVSATASNVWLSETVPGGYQTSPPPSSASGHISQILGPAVPGQGVGFLLQAPNPI